MISETSTTRLFFSQWFIDQHSLEKLNRPVNGTTICNFLSLYSAVHRWTTSWNGHDCSIVNIRFSFHTFNEHWSFSMENKNRMHPWQWWFTMTSITERTWPAVHVHVRHFTCRDLFFSFFSSFLLTKKKWPIDELIQLTDFFFYFSTVYALNRHSRYNMTFFILISISILSVTGRHDEFVFFFSFICVCHPSAKSTSLYIWTSTDGRILFIWKWSRNSFIVQR